jgi:hypothetical protein
MDKEVCFRAQDRLSVRSDLRQLVHYLILIARLS